jgi:hypothetical protein
VNLTDSAVPTQSRALYESPIDPDNGRIIITDLGGGSVRIDAVQTGVQYGEPYDMFAGAVIDDLGDMLRQVAAASGQYAVVALAPMDKVTDTPLGNLCELPNGCHELAVTRQARRLDEAELWTLAAQFASAATRRAHRDALTARIRGALAQAREAGLGGDLDVIAARVTAAVSASPAAAPN